MDKLKAVFSWIVVALWRWIEFSGLAMNIALVTPFLIFLIAIAVVFPFAGLYYAITHPSPLGNLIVFSLVVAGVTVVWRIVQSRDDESPVKRGRKLLHQEDAERVSRSRLDRSNTRNKDK